MAITTTAEYKADAGITVSTDDTLIGQLVDAAQGELEDAIGYTLDGAERTETYDGAGSPLIVLRAFPVASITSVTPVGADSVAGTAWAATDYKFDPDAGILSLTPEGWARFVRDDFGVVVGEFGDGAAFDNQFRNVRVVYKAGYGSSPYTAIPTWIKRRIWKIVDAMYLSDQIRTGGGGAERPDVDAVVEAMAKGLRRGLP